MIRVVAVQSHTMRVAPIRSVSPTTSLEEGIDEEEGRSAAAAPSCSAAPAGKARRGGYMVRLYWKMAVMKYLKQAGASMCLWPAGQALVLPEQRRMVGT